VDTGFFYIVLPIMEGQMVHFYKTRREKMKKCFIFAVMVLFAASGVFAQAVQTITRAEQQRAGASIRLIDSRGNTIGRDVSVRGNEVLAGWGSDFIVVWDAARSGGTTIRTIGTNGREIATRSWDNSRHSVRVEYDVIVVTIVRGGSTERFDRSLRPAR